GSNIVPVKFTNAWLGRAWPTQLLDLIANGLNSNLLDDARRTPSALRRDQVAFAPLYRHPRKIWGIGLNFRDHAADLSAPFPTEPASFMKGDHTIIGPGDPIRLPAESQRVTAEAELGVIVGRQCRDVPESAAASVIAGYCLVLDMTAADILQRNPRFLTRSKNFDTFFSFGPELITPDEVGDVGQLKVGTYRNAILHRENVVAHMAFSPDHLVSFHSRFMTLYPGDIISTGTPGAVVIEHGDIAECRIEGLGELINPVQRRVRTDFEALASVGV
ncbi:MAG TPA: fumarylacetoacetate hydrolase family protein, partial [Burkholderiales bacterium]|nr:fumarylacetoacetate hydrolase family protein [Burkholderiales bacterium]